MFTPWIKRKALKRSSKSKALVVNGESPSLIMLLSLSVLCVMVGVYLTQKSQAATNRVEVLTPAPLTATPSQTPALHPPAPTNVMKMPH